MRESWQNSTLRRYKIKKLLGIFGALLLGAIIVMVIDQCLIGVSLKGVSGEARFAHAFIYMLWGGVITGVMIKRFG